MSRTARDGLAFDSVVLAVLNFSVDSGAAAAASFVAESTETSVGNGRCCCLLRACRLRLDAADDDAGLFVCISGSRPICLLLCSWDGRTCPSFFFLFAYCTYN